MLLASVAFAGTLAPDAGGPYSVNAGSSTTLDGSGTTATGNCTGLEYRWDTDGDGTYDTSWSSSSSTTFSAASYDGPASVTPVLQVTSSRCGETGTDSATVTIANVAPVIWGVTVDTSVSEGEAQTVVVAYTDVESADTHSIAWTFGDGTTAATASASKTWTDDGSYTVTVTVTDDDGGSDSETTTVTVTNVAPTISALTPSATSTYEGTTLSFTCAATDPGADTLTYAWTFGDGDSASGASTTHSYADDGSYTVRCTATDDDGGSDTESVTITVANVAPVASASASASGTEGTAISFTCSATDAGTDDTISYAWEFSDGATAAGATVSHTYVDEGSYVAICTATDDDGDSGTDTVTTVVSNVAPTLSSLTGASSGDEGDSFAFDCVASDPGDDTLTYTWSFGDGSTGSGESVTHTYADDGSFTLRCTVSDGDGGSDSESTTITVDNVAPTITSSSIPTSADEGDSLTFTVAATDPGSETLSYTWDFGDGTSGSGTSTTHSYTEDGTYAVAVTVSDGDGGTDTASGSVTVRNTAPVIVTLSGDTSGVEGDTLSWDVAYMDSGADDVLTVTWDFDDGDGDGNVDATSHTYADDGTYDLTVQVCDDDGDCDSAGLTVVIANADPVISSFTGDTAGDEGDSFSFACTATDAGTDDIVSYTLDMGDGTTALGAVASHTFADDGTYTVTCDVSDHDGGTDSASLTVIVQNVAPTLTSATTSVTGDEGETLSFAATATDPGDDTITYTWDFGDGDTATGGTATHAYAEDGTYAFTVTASDEDGGSTSSTGVATIGNADPTVALAGDTTGTEGDTFAFTATVSDAGSADTHTCTWDFGDGGTETGTAPTHVYADDGSYAVTVTCADDDGGSGSASTTVTVSNASPTITALTGDTEGDEGATLTFTCAATDPGDDTVSVFWSFGDGGTDVGDTVTHAFANDGTYTVTCLAADEDGGVDSETLSVEIRNVAPSIDAIAADATGEEGETLSYAVTVSDPGDDPLTVTWDWADGTTDVGESVTHAWGDNGAWEVLVTVTDDDESVTTSFTVDTTNVAPSIEGTPDATVYVDATFTFTPTLADPGFDDTHTWALTGPGSLDATTGEVTWTPAAADEGVWSLQLAVTDDDGESGTLDWTLEVIFVDDDGDGMSDTWEDAYGVDDPAADEDGDGRTNLEEYTDGTDPTRYDGPSTPVPWSPADGGEVADAAVALVVENATSPTGEILTYDLELYSDEAMTALVTGTVGVAEDAGGYTGWTVDVALTENTWYWWWASASDAYTTTDWSEASSFFYNTVNEAPTAPAVDSPWDGGSTATVTPTLVLDPATDPDGDPLLYAFALLDEAGVVVATTGGVDGTEWTVDVALADLATYCWYGQATDDEGLSGPVSDTACFFVDLSNEPPSTPVIVAPVDGAGVLTLTTDVVITEGVDPEGRDVEHTLELDVDAAFPSPVTATLTGDGSGTLTWTTPELTDDTWYFVRVRASDGATASDWAQASFFVNPEDTAPSTPALHNPPADAAWTSGTPLDVVNATDPEGDALVYEFVVYLSGAETQGATVSEDESGYTAWTPEDMADGVYTWTARAVDPFGLASDWAEERVFTVSTGTGGDTGDPIPDDTGAKAATTTTADADGCGCASAPKWPAGLLVLALAALRRRRDPRVG
jgi:MYXO-CTERM domain-containing protein